MEGVITVVSGDLTTVRSFVVLDDAGRSHKFRPVDGLLFYGGSPTHLRDHVVAGQRVKVTYEEMDMVGNGRRGARSGTANVR